MYKQNIFDKGQTSPIDSIFKDETVFYQSYFPLEIKARDNEIKELSYCLSPLTAGNRARNVLIYGPPGTGKTLVSSFVLKQLQEYTQKVSVLYINAMEDNTRFAVYSKILTTQLSIPIPRRGLGVDELLNRLKEGLSKSSKLPILVIDEVDKFSKQEISAFLYELSRTELNHRFFTLILITNHKEFLAELDPRAQSTLFLSEIEFKRYNPKELKEILAERIDYGLVKNAISQDLIGYITGYSAKNGGDARVAIDLLYKSAKLAEKQGLCKIQKEMITQSSKLIDSVKLIEKLSYITALDKEILSNIPEQGIESGELYKTLASKEADRTIRRHLGNLENLGLITTTDYKGKTGKTRLITLTFTKELLK